jgi:bacteriocin-like protein
MTELTLNELQQIDGGDGSDYLWGFVVLAGALAAPLEAPILVGAAIVAGAALLL